jgi:hypothetical protein
VCERVVELGSVLTAPVLCHFDFVSVPLRISIRLAVIRENCSTSLVPPSDIGSALSALGVTSLLAMDYHISKGFRMSPHNVKAYDAITTALVNAANDFEGSQELSNTRALALRPPSVKRAVTH